MKNIILASGSPRRRELLQQIGLEFEVITSNAEEVTTHSSPGEIVKELSRLKARAVADILTEEKRKQSVVIGADTIVYAQGKVLGKPKNEADAYKMIAALAGKTHDVYTGVTFVSDREEYSFFEQTSVEVYEMTDEEIQAYIRTGEPMDKAGAYGIQGAFAAYVKGISGDYNNVVGLPAAGVYQALKRTGWLCQ